MKKELANSIVKMKTLIENYTELEKEHNKMIALGKKVEKEILSENIFYDETTQERITDPEDSYLMSEEDFDRFMDLIQEKREKIGCTIEHGKSWDVNLWDKFHPLKKQMVEVANTILNLKGCFDLAKSLDDVLHEQDLFAELLDILKQICGITR